MNDRRERVVNRFVNVVVFVFLAFWMFDDSRAADVKDFGAVGDGVVDDTVAIQKAVDAAMGSVTFGQGTYLLSKSVRIELDRVGFCSLLGDGSATILMAGEGPAFEFIGTHEGTASPTTVKENIWQKQRSPLVDALEITGKHPLASGIAARGTMQLVVSRTTIRKMLHGVHLVERNRNVILSECHIYENEGVGVFLDHVNLHQINIANCHISYNKQGGVVNLGGNVRNIQIGTCDIEGNMGSDSKPTANVLLDCTKGSVAEVAIVGCTIQHTHNAPESANVRFIGNGERIRSGGVEKINLGNVTISNNVLSDAQLNIDIVGGRGISIVGNTIWKGYTNDIRIRESSHVAIGANVLERNPQYQEEKESKGGMVLSHCRDVTISGLLLARSQGRAGVELEQCHRVNMSGCSILDVQNVGLLVKDCSRCLITGCMISKEKEGDEKWTATQVTGGSHFQMSGNQFD